MKFILFAAFALPAHAGLATVLQPDPFIDLRLSQTVSRDADGTTQRNPAVVAAFKKQWPCPETKKNVGACPGWAVDHVIPLACGGADAVWNMQWLPVEIKSAKGKVSKDHFERRVYGGHAMSKGCP